MWASTVFIFVGEATPTRIALRALSETPSRTAPLAISRASAHCCAVCTGHHELLGMLETMCNVTVLYLHALLEPQHVRAQSMPAH